MLPSVSGDTSRAASMNPLFLLASVSDAEVSGSPPYLLTRRLRRHVLGPGITFVFAGSEPAVLLRRHDVKRAQRADGLKLGMWAWTSWAVAFLRRFRLGEALTPLACCPVAAPAPRVLFVRYYEAGRFRNQRVPVIAHFWSQFHDTGRPDVPQIPDLCKSGQHHANRKF